MNALIELESQLRLEQRKLKKEPSLLLDARKKIVRKMRQAFGDIIIRRTASSCGANGMRLNGLLPPKITYFDIEMTPSERAAFEEIKKSIRKNM